MSFSREKVASLILEGQTIIVYRDNVLRIPKFWLDAHPGGSLSLLHFVGRDATDEIDAYHCDAALAMVHKYAIGKLQDAPWVSLLPPVMSGWTHSQGKWFKEASPDPSRSLHQVTRVEDAPTMDDLIPPAVPALDQEVQARQAAAYRQLHKRVIDAGLYKCPFFTGYGPEVFRYVLLGATSAFAYYHNWLMTSAVLLGLMWHQLMFFVHDLGHIGVSGNWNIDRLISIFVADFIGGLSVGWWVDNHNIHHLVTNHPTHDPDIEHLPFFAISPVFFNNIYSSYYKKTLKFDAAARFFVQLQHKLFYIVMMFGRFNLYVRSYTSIFNRAFDTKRARGHGWAWGLEVLGVACFWVWFSQVLIGCGTWQKALMYVLVSHAATSPLHITIVLSHFSMSTEDLGPAESWPHRQMRTTTDIYCPDSIAFIHGGLQLQVAHHLFPRVPRHNLRKASDMVKEFAAEQGLTYAEFGFMTGNQEVLGVLKEVAGMVHHLKVFAEVANTEAKEAVDKKIKASEKAANLY
ncbi:delta 8-sphingoloid desaturase protein [Mucidula mucida]|nr:delta 8-sphingoloid desaturase protein [Mucidula mucida]